MHRKNDKGVDPGAPSAAPQTAQNLKRSDGHVRREAPATAVPQSAKCAGRLGLGRAGRVCAGARRMRGGPEVRETRRLGQSRLERASGPADRDRDRCRQPVVEGVQRSRARSAGRARLPAEPAAADRRPADRGGPRPAGRSRSGGSIPQMQEIFASATAVGLSEHAANVRQLRSPLLATTRLGFDAAWELDFWGKYRRGVRGGGRQPARVGGRLRRRARLAHRGGRADLRRDPHLRGAHRAGPARTPGSRRRGCGSPSPASATAPPRSST